MQRRLTTILAADIAGFSRLVGADEEAILFAQRAHRAELIDPLLSRHGGRVANSAGDSLLIEFPSAVEAMRCAAAIQDGMRARNRDVPEDRRIVYRMGVNVGDVMVVDGDDLLGDAVNVAARLEQHCPPGGIVISRAARDAVRDRLALQLADLGEIAVRNIARPVRAFAVLAAGDAAARAPAPGGAGPQRPPGDGAVDPVGKLKQVIRYTRSSDGTAIAWAASGEGPPLLRGGHWLGHLEHDWSSPVWAPLLARLSSARRLIRYDPRGVGLSDRRMNGATVEELADDMEAVADAAGLERFPIYATSQSVPAALTLAARRPDRVSRLILLNGFVEGSSVRGEIEKTETMVGMIRAGWGVPGSAFMRALATVFMPHATPEELDSLMKMQALSATADVAAELRRIIGLIDVRRYLEKVTCPTLVMHFSGDQVQPAEQSRIMARELKAAEFHLLESQNHVLVPSDPVWARCLDEIDRFLAEGVVES